MTTFRPCFLIPCYNHGKTVPAVVESLMSFGYPMLIVDDGSNRETKQILADVTANNNQITLITLADNQGKGGAVIAGIEAAYQRSFSHAIQIDADGQHDLEALPKLIKESQTHPTALISGQPIYDESVPKSRLYGRYVTHVWVWIETLSFAIKDSMCGFRSYPIGPTIGVLERVVIGRRMDFDTEIMVRMYWNETDVRFVNTRVIYPEDGISHFDALWDNVKISWMHTKLVFGMLPRIPSLLRRQPIQDDHWSSHAERGTILGIQFLLWIYSTFGRGVFSVLLKPVMAYYYLRGGSVKQASDDFIQQVNAYARIKGITQPEKLSPYRHLVSFGETMLDKLAAWRGDFSERNLTVHGIEHYEALFKREKGIVMLGSHLGNLELCRALSRRHKELKINALVFTDHAERFNTVMRTVNPQSDINLIQVSKMGPDTAILLQQKIDAGEWIVIVGDRTSVTKEDRVIWADFLGKPAPFPQGPFMLASILKQPVYLMFGLRDDTQKEPRFDVYFEPFSEQIILPRGQREEALQEVVQNYAQRLEHFTLKAPSQWYNFFNFWQLTGKKDDN
ncbi:MULTISPECIES: glycosyltransferase family 2 protein [Aliivibrio]|uniref:Glycosyltransferase family 2 protein n=1 Tax=Aliivibrio finisterrensis TaxID=511998 RepID=A0A4Q5KUE7_9GAMM|nr:MULTISPECIES: glycosyltransferase family 2 protein [Aliivibrio]MDD9178876.1 glycosyltransferase [Aliivibrio sp. A6]RYU51723.1 glycosyltransferase family 2 protein [Aliivibrio finisterrensis]RYU53197.1 glycosyltransferase family 2 protein [Aliivibrio finisterrensis]RYU58655.1 glycosyltransferase family 2 protein [Aliivibrio finisterrensis]RYU64830.1 glycosyltransferase family 2 protein [Aliivibrio finisterrensis]